jgi:hypothetical protein
MKSLLITYDLITPGRDYAKLYEAIKAQGTWWHCLESVWIVRTAATSIQVANILKQHVDANDKLAVLQVQGDWATYNLSDECSNWLKTNM